MKKDKAKRDNTTSITTFGSLSSKTKEPHVYKGVKNKTAFPEFVELCKMTQNELKAELPFKLFDAGYRGVVTDDGFIYAKGEIPILLTAHMDTVHKEVIKEFYEFIDEHGNHILSSPQGIGGDDRCGIYMILELIKKYKPYVLFCEDEEIGGVGSKKFCKTELIDELKDMKFLIELDRMNGNDAVFYDCENPEFTKFIEETTGYKEAWGSFSDISTLAPACKVAAVNLSCGYYHAHTLAEEVNVEEMLNTIKVVEKLLETETEQYEYIERVRYYDKYCGGWYDGYDKYYSNYYGSNKSYKDPYDDDDLFVMLFVDYYNEKGQEVSDIAYGYTKDNAMLAFFEDHPTVCWNNIIDTNYDYVDMNDL